MPIICYRALHSYFNNKRCRKAYAIRPQGDMGNVLIYLPHLAMAHPYRKYITWASVYGTFNIPTAVTTVKLQPNHLLSRKLKPGGGYSYIHANGYVPL